MPEAVGRIFADEAFKKDAKDSVRDFIFPQLTPHDVPHHMIPLNIYSKSFRKLKFRKRVASDV